jgi:hypothetical protein
MANQPTQEPYMKSYEILAQEYGNWIWKEQDQDRDVYYITILFRHLNGPPAAVITQMKSLIENQFYPTLCRNIDRHPGRKSRWPYLPHLVLFPDLPVYKSGRTVPSRRLVSHGLHYNGLLSVSDWSRVALEEHLRRKRSLYARNGIVRVHVIPVQYDPHRIAGYSIKTVKCGRLSYDDTIILPRPWEPKPPNIDPKSKAKKDIQSRFNLSDEIADQFVE